MHAPASFRMDDQAEMAAFIEARCFATLVVAGPDGPEAAHIPMILKRDEMGRPVSVEGHVARSNPVAAIAATPTRALAIFAGADAYVTPSLYASKREHGKVVPTWNYIAVHASGVLESFNDPETLHGQVDRMTDMMEHPAEAPWRVSDAPGEYITGMLRAITGVRLAIASIEGVAKLSQNKAENDRLSVRRAFETSTDHAARDLAAEMSRKAP